MKKTRVLTQTKDILKEVAQKTGNSYDDVKKIYDSFIRSLESAVEDMDVYAINMVHLGTFHINRRYLEEFLAFQPADSELRKKLRSRLDYIKYKSDHKEKKEWLHNAFPIEKKVNDLLPEEEKVVFKGRNQSLKYRGEIIKKIEKIQNEE